MLRTTLFLTILAMDLFQTSVTCRMSHSISFLLDIQLQWLCIKYIKSGAFSLYSGSCYWFYPNRYLGPTHDEKSFRREREKNSWLLTLVIQNISFRYHWKILREKKKGQKDGEHCRQAGRSWNRILWSHFAMQLKCSEVFIKANNYAILYCLRLL